MTDYHGNIFIDMERALAKGVKGLALTPNQMRQILAEVAALVTAKNELVRENIALRGILPSPNIPTGISCREPSPSGESND